MTIEILPLTLEDVSKCAEIYERAFENDVISLKCFPRTSGKLAEWWTATNTEDFQSQPAARFLKAVEGDNIIAYAKWNVPVDTEHGFDNGGDDPDDLPAWPEGSNEELANKFFGTLARRRKEIMGDRPHCCL
jgi:hypothetical protein